MDAEAIVRAHLQAKARETAAQLLYVAALQIAAAQERWLEAMGSEIMHRLDEVLR